MYRTRLEIDSIQSNIAIIDITWMEQNIYTGCPLRRHPLRCGFRQVKRLGNLTMFGFVICQYFITIRLCQRQCENTDLKIWRYCGKCSRHILIIVNAQNNIKRTKVLPVAPSSIDGFQKLLTTWINKRRAIVLTRAYAHKLCTNPINKNAFKNTIDAHIRRSYLIGDLYFTRRLWLKKIALNSLICCELALKIVQHDCRMRTS